MVAVGQMFKNEIVTLWTIGVGTVCIVQNLTAATLVLDGEWRLDYFPQPDSGAVRTLAIPAHGTVTATVPGCCEMELVREGLLPTPEIGVGADDIDAFVPHQANVYMIRQLAKALKIPAEKLLVSGDEVGNSASATVPVTISRCAKGGQRLLLSGFGGGLSASVATVTLSKDVLLKCIDF